MLIFLDLFAAIHDMHSQGCCFIPVVLLHSSNGHAVDNPSLCCTVRTHMCCDSSCDSSPCIILYHAVRFYISQMHYVAFCITEKNTFHLLSIVISFSSVITSYDNLVWIKVIKNNSQVSRINLWLEDVNWIISFPDTLCIKSEYFLFSYVIWILPNNCIYMYQYLCLLDI